MSRIKKKDEIVTELKTKNSELEGQIKSLEGSMSMDTKNMHNKLLSMNKSMMNLKQMYNELLNANVADSELKIIQKKLKRREDRIKQLEKELGATRIQVAEVKSQIAVLSEACQKQGMNGSQILDSSQPRFSHQVRTLHGGGGRRVKKSKGISVSELQALNSKSSRRDPPEAARRHFGQMESASLRKGSDEDQL